MNANAGGTADGCGEQGEGVPGGQTGCHGIQAAAGWSESTGQGAQGNGLLQDNHSCLAHSLPDSLYHAQFINSTPIHMVVAVVASGGLLSKVGRKSLHVSMLLFKHACKNCLRKHMQVDELKKRSEDLKREAHIRKRHQEEHRRRLQELEVRQIDSNEKFNSLEEEVQVKSRQLKKLFEKYQAKKAEINDVQEQFQAERESMLDDYRILTQQVSGVWGCVLGFDGGGFGLLGGGGGLGTVGIYPL
eukprot:scaffold26142_cov17-Tisochrysis_lutea.AAC.1